jgi:integrase
MMAKSLPLCFSVATLLAFDCYLRVSEITALKNSDIILSSSTANELPDHKDDLPSGQTLIRLAQTKTGNNKLVILNRSALGILLARLKESCGPHERLFPFSKFRYRSAFKQICTDLGLDAFNFRPHSLRHGGASHDYMLGLKVEDIMIKGRWQSLIAVRRYLQSAKSLFIKHQQSYFPHRPLPVLHSTDPQYVVSLILLLSDSPSLPEADTTEEVVDAFAETL